jgi:hypothetical protein
LLAVVDDLLVIAGLVAVIFVIYGGIRYITSQGSPNETAQAQSTIIYALVGLAIAIIAIPTVSYLGTKLGTGTGGSSNIPASNGATLNLKSLPNPGGAVNGGIVGTIFQDAFGIIGAMALLFIVIGGLRYVFSSGDPQAAATAKSTIIYALIGLIIAIVAESIVTLIIGKIK